MFYKLFFEYILNTKPEIIFRDLIFSNKLDILNINNINTIS